MSADIITELADLAARIPQPDDTTNLDHLIDMWDALDTITKTLAAHTRNYNTAAADRLAETDYTPKDGYQSHGGVIVHHTQRPSDQWDGQRLLSKLAVNVVETATGELVQAVPVEVLEDVIPAVTGKSSRWLVKGLELHGINPNQYRERSWGHPTISRGGKR